MARGGYTRLPGKSRRYRSPTGEIVSHRQYETRTSHPGKSRETHTRELKAGKAQYRTKQAKEAVKYKRRTIAVRNAIPEITSKDLKLIDAYRMGGRFWFRNASEEDKAAYRALFDRYPREQVIEALGSPQVRKAA